MKVQERFLRLLVFLLVFCPAVLSAATEATVYFTCATNYRVCPEMFCDDSRGKALSARDPAKEAANSV